MRLSRKLGGLLAAAMMATGLTAAAMPARASIPSSEIMTNRGNGTVHECLQDDTGGTVTQHFCDPTFTNAHQGFSSYQRDSV
jgi:hypothetical protein